MSLEETASLKSQGGKRLPRGSGRFRKLVKDRSSRQRPQNIDLKKIAAWAQVGCTREEMASLLNVDLGWFNDAIQQDFELEKAIVVGSANFKTSLRSTQARLALSGHPAMLIWLGKQFLGQSDKQENRNETTVNVVLQNAVKELRDMGEGDLLAIKEILEQKKTPLIENGVSDAQIIEG